ncbi:MAG: hypothetical protein ACSLFD_12610 [Solirubrobacterales bacterium]
MRRIATAAMIAGALAFTAAPAVASQPSDKPAGPPAGKAAKAKAYGKYCQGQSKKHVKGVKGTAFSTCVKAMAQVAKTVSEGGNAAPRKVCKDLSKKHVKGEKGTPFSRCVVGAQELKRELRETEEI